MKIFISAAKNAFQHCLLSFKKERLSRNYADLLALEEKHGMKVTKSYKTDRAAASFVDVIGQSMKDLFAEDLLSANYYLSLPMKAPMQVY